MFHPVLLETHLPEYPEDRHISIYTISFLLQLISSFRFRLVSSSKPSSRKLHIWVKNLNFHSFFLPLTFSTLLNLIQKFFTPRGQFPTLLQILEFCTPIFFSLLYTLLYCVNFKFHFYNHALCNTHYIFFN